MLIRPGTGSRSSSSYNQPVAGYDKSPLGSPSLLRHVTGSKPDWDVMHGSKPSSNGLGVRLDREVMM